MVLRVFVFRVFVFMGLALSIYGQAPAKKYSAPRTADGQPDLQGVWTNATVTPLERPADLAGKAVFTPAEAVAWERSIVERNNVDNRPKDSTADVAAAYNEGWYDRGTHVVKTLRTSLIVDPPDGKLPALTEAGQKRAAEVAEQRRLHPADGPESRSLTERCIIWPMAGPPMVPGPYNNNYQIFQTPGYVTILIEMIHEVRVIPISNKPAAGASHQTAAGAAHLPSNIKQWMGDSRGHWEGETLVVDTTNFTGKSRFRNTGENLHLTERFTRTDANTILYEFTVNDPENYTAPWTAQLTMAKTDAKVYEYACHEGNYGMVGILAGARAAERNQK